MDVSKMKTQVPAIKDRLAALAERRREVLSQPPAEALDLILQDPQPAALVHSFPEQDLFFLIQDIGPEDALPLLALISDRQREFIFDMQAWSRDRLSSPGIIRWLQLMLAADPTRLVSWLADGKTEFFEHFLFSNIELRIREHDQDASEFDSEFFTRDDVFYVRVLEVPPVADDTFAEAGSTENTRKEVIGDLLQRLALWDYPKYQAILLEAMSVIPAEVEEEQYRLRNVRLAEKGFLPFDEAVGVYQALEPEALEGRAPGRGGKKIDPGLRYQAPEVPVALVDGNTLFAGVLERMEPGAVLDGLQAEFAALCNRIIVADGRRVSNKDDLRAVVRKACATISIGLEAAGEKLGHPSQAVGLIRRHSLTDIFRVGFGRSLRLRWRAQRWLQGSWFKQAGLPLTFWDEHWTGVLGGLLVKKPLCYDPTGGESVYREFESAEDIRRAEGVLDDIINLDALLAAIQPKIDPEVSRGAVSYKNLILTLWARDWLGLAPTADSPPLAADLPLEALRDFFGALFTNPSGGSGARRVPDAMKTAFVTWLASATGQDREAIGETAGAALACLFDELEEECARVSPRDLDPRFMRMFLIEGGGES